MEEGDEGHPPQPADRIPHRLIFPFGGLNQVWGVLMAAKSDDPVERREIRRQRRWVAALMILTTVVGFLLVFVGHIR